MKLAVIGAGVMGRNHAAAARACDGVTLTAIVDADEARARALAAECGCAAASTIDAVIGHSDAAVVATPTATHKALAETLLRAGVHCLVEKPLAMSLPQCQALIAAANGAILQVGHIERFNPGVEDLFARGIAPAAIRRVTARRMNPGSARVKDIDVVVDLMIHDLDIVMALKAGQAVTDITATGDADDATATLTFADGCMATLTASRVTQNRLRNLDLMLDDGFAQLDFLTREVRMARDDKPLYRNTSQGDAIQKQLTHFAACVRNGERPRVSGEEALAVMVVAWRIQAALADQT